MWRLKLEFKSSELTKFQSFWSFNLFLRILGKVIKFLVYYHQSESRQIIPCVCWGAFIIAMQQVSSIKYNIHPSNLIPPTHVFNGKFMFLGFFVWVLISLYRIFESNSTLSIELLVFSCSWKNITWTYQRSWSNLCGVQNWSLSHLNWLNFNLFDHSTCFLESWAKLLSFECISSKWITTNHSVRLLRCIHNILVSELWL